MGHKLLGQILLEIGKISQYQLDQALKLQKEDQELLGKILVSQGWITEAEISQAVAKQLNVNYIDLNNTLINQDVIRLIPQAIAVKYNVLPLFLQDDALYLAMEHPRDSEVLQRMEIQAAMPVKPLIAPPGQLHNVVRKHYDVEQYVGNMLDNVEEDVLVIEQVHSFIQKSQVIKLANLLLSSGVKRQASEIHIEPANDAVKVRLNINGKLGRGIRIPKWLHYPLTARIKVMAFIDITETTKSLSGQIKASFGKEKVELRITTFPAEGGEKIIIQIIRKTCQGCGESLEDAWKLCPFCGKAVEVLLPPSAVQHAQDTVAPRLVFADDEASIRDKVQNLLEQRGYQVIPATNGEDALTKIREELPDLAILDRNMPRRGGFSVCQAIRSTVDTMFIPVIILTGDGSMEERLEGLTAGVDDYIIKPFETNAFLGKVETILQKM